MVWYIVQRCIGALITLFIVAAVIFAATELLPGDVATALLGRDATPKRLAQVRAQLRRWWGPQVNQWRTLRVDRIAHGQPNDAPPSAPKQRVALGEGLFVCGDHRDTPSIQGALFSGRRCAAAILAG